ncbi:MAG: hypothetical protein V9G19_17745 [Tetrasphaera sp.]
MGVAFGAILALTGAVPVMVGAAAAPSGPPAANVDAGLGRRAGAVTVGSGEFVGGGTIHALVRAGDTGTLVAAATAKGFIDRPTA